MPPEFEWDEQKNRANRVISMGRLSRMVVVVVVHTDRGGQIRLISARKANRTERQAYYEHLEETASAD